MRERRLFERIEAPMKIRYEVLKQPPQKATASKDIGGGGIRLALEEELKEGTNLKLTIEVPGEKDKVTTAYGRVVWTRQVQVSGGLTQSDYYETGIEFTKVDVLTLGRIYKYFQKK